MPIPFVIKVSGGKTINTVEEESLLHDWLEAAGSDGNFSLIYQSSRDGLLAFWLCVCRWWGVCRLSANKSN